MTSFLYISFFLIVVIVVVIIFIVTVSPLGFLFFDIISDFSEVVDVDCERFNFTFSGRFDSI